MQFINFIIHGIEYVCNINYVSSYIVLTYRLICCSAIKSLGMLEKNGKEWNLCKISIDFHVWMKITGKEWKRMEFFEISIIFPCMDENHWNILEKHGIWTKMLGIDWKTMDLSS